MGRKSRKSPGKELNKIALQRRMEIDILVAKLLKLTSDPRIFPNTMTPAKSWEHYSEIQSLLSQIHNLELGLGKSGKRNRRSNLDNFVKWLKDNGASFDGVEISPFDGYELGLKATKEFPENDLILTVPRRLMMSEQDAKESELSSYISMDTLLLNMPHITLSMFLLLEKSKPDSFWKPYIDILPEKYVTVLYFTPEDMLQLKPSPVLEPSLKLYRSIARQYAYFYKKIFSVDLPVMKQLQEIFTFDNYRWAVSTVMTRQNNVYSAVGDFTAFIPLWDMCNHEQGRITTDFNRTLDRGECYAVRDFKPGEQIFIFYGDRPNCDFFLHNSFVDPNNAHDSLSVALGVAASDGLREKKLQLLEKLGLNHVTQFSLYRAEMPLSAELLAFIRIFNMNEEELTKWLEGGIPGDLVSAEAEVGAGTDERAHAYLLQRLRLLRAAYARSEPADAGAAADDTHRKNIKLLKESEVRILDGAIKYLENTLEKLKESKSAKE